MDQSFLIMLPAECSIALIAAELYLLTLRNHLVIQDSGIEVCPLAAPAYRFDLLYIVSQFHKPL